MENVKQVVIYLILAAFAAFCVLFITHNATRSGIYACYITDQEKAEVAKQVKKDRLITSVIIGYNVHPAMAERIVTAVMKSTENKHPKLSPELVLAVMAKESRFKHDAVSPGGTGLMQITFAAFGKPASTHIETNVRSGARLLNNYLHKFPKDKAIAAYNIGEGTVRMGGYNEQYVAGVKKHLRRIQNV